MDPELAIVELPQHMVGTADGPVGGPTALLTTFPRENDGGSPVDDTGTQPVAAARTFGSGNAVARDADEHGARCVGNGTRGTDDMAAFELAAPPPALASTSQQRTRARHAAALTASAEPEAAITVDALAVRADLMFIAGLPEPGASAMNALASKATKGLVRLASKLVSDWPQARIDNLSRSYGNFDRVVALGWLL
jgi:hypothetical protein